ncbi:MAG: molybdopterin-dependent oxidoreductase [Actinomycetota bacterium]
MSQPSSTASGTTSTHYRTCPLCEACCGLEITVQDGTVKRVRGDQADPFSKGFICPKGSTLKQLHEDPDRLTAPRIRTDEGWTEVSWDEAFAEIDRRLQPIVERHGRDGLGVVIGNPSTHNLGGMLYGRSVLMAAGTRKLFSASTVDQMPKHVSAGLMWGRPDMFPLPDIDNTDYMLILGANPFISNGSLVTAPDMPGRLTALAERGTLVVVDPARTKTAQAATEHLAIRPGTDTWWLLALIHTLFEEDLVDVGRLADHTSGVEQVRGLVADYSPEAVADRCGIDATTTRRIAREFATAERAAAYGRMGAHTVEFGTLASWATDVLNALTGNIDEPGGIMFNSSPTQLLAPSTPGGRGFELGRWEGPASGFPEVKGELPAATLAEEIVDPAGGIEALFVMACNPVRSFPNSARIAEALDDIGLLVVVDPYMTATAKRAHVVLPPTSALERSHYDLVFESAMLRAYAKYSPPVFETDGMREEEILARLSLVIGGAGPDADPLGVHRQLIEGMVDAEVGRSSSPIHGRDRHEILDALEPWTWSEQVLDLKLRVARFGDHFGQRPEGITLQKLRDEHPHGRDFGPLQQRFPDGIKTKSGTLELAPAPIVADLARLAAAPAADEGMTLIGRRNLRTVNSWLHNVNVLIKGREQCTLQVNPLDAERLGLAPEGTAIVRSAVGQVTAPVEVTDAIMPGVVCLPHGWGYEEDGIEMNTARTRPGVNSNALTDDAPLDRLSGNAVLNGIPVEVVPT